MSPLFPFDSVSSLRSSHLLETRRIYDQGVDTVLSVCKNQFYTIPTRDDVRDCMCTVRTVVESIHYTTTRTVKKN